MQFLRSILFMLVLSIALPTSAHETLPKEWCLDPATTPQIVMKFEYEEKELVELAYNLPVESKCGIVDGLPGDDAWHAAVHIAHNACATEGLKRIPMPIVDTPMYNDKNHHKLYDLSHGLSGVCVVCVNPTR